MVTKLYVHMEFSQFADPGKFDLAYLELGLEPFGDN